MCVLSAFITTYFSLMQNYIRIYLVRDKKKIFLTANFITILFWQQLLFEFFLWNILSCHSCTPLGTHKEIPTIFFPSPSPKLQIKKFLRQCYTQFSKFFTHDTKKTLYKTHVFNTLTATRLIHWYGRYITDSFSVLNIYKNGD